ncbi:MAG: glycosyltransferase family 2 protein [candidate division KSB1 bacterium]|nr:glycosyltransferase family 2 protein [candidate division KSB1 bacterium]MDZ7273672.1 glycosyltransferase family 2 protein [candidate division KSB1 bacterium]MDZ7285828.1 glycosyltransferase family 2 protein [candidate division KSB1 bacterium]MDZ7298860.1 glycosyltransferase family 2 protein [candidate division KSB1 bacterium]MDZ7307094.1 glycosyltransferase family 2 protein [candidate division KSB1 bacterium]
MVLSIIIPLYNERATIAQVIERVLAVPCAKQIIVVDDGSTDGSAEIVAALARTQPLLLLSHPRNLGKGQAIKTGLTAATGEVIIIQDADLEYHPEDYPAALALIEQGWADAVYGSRFLGPHRVFLFWHFVGNRLLTLLANVITSGILSDMETGFKVIRAAVLRDLAIQSCSFDFEVEVTIKLFKYGYRVYEIPITYTGRDYHEGKKITWRDGVRALLALLKWGVLVRRRRQQATPARRGG